MGLGKPAAEANPGSECSGLRSPHSRYSSACCGSVGIDSSTSGARSGGSADVEGPRSPPKPPSPRAKMDRFCVHSGAPSGVVTVGLRPDHRGLALVPDLGEPRDGPPRARRRDGAGHGDGLAGVQHPRQLDVDAGELHRRCGGHVEALRHAAERRQHLRGVVDEVTQFALVEWVGTGAEAQMVELDVATAPREFDGGQLGADGLVEVDRHPSALSGQVQGGQVAERHGGPDRPAGARDRCGPSPVS